MPAPGLIPPAAGQRGGVRRPEPAHFRWRRTCSGISSATGLSNVSGAPTTDIHLTDQFTESFGAFTADLNPSGPFRFKPGLSRFKVHRPVFNFLFERAQALDQRLASHLMVVSVFPDGGGRKFPFLGGFTKWNVRRLIESPTKTSGTRCDRPASRAGRYRSSSFT